MNRLYDYFILLLSLLFISTAGPFQVASGVDVLASVSIRLMASSAVFFVWAIWRGQALPPRGQMKELSLGAFFMVTHFVLWFKAFDLTDYASTLLLLVAQPIFAAVLAPVFGESISKKAWIAVGIALVGMVIIAGGDVSLGPKALFGDLLALLGALAIAVYFGVTKKTRNLMPMGTFMAWTMGLGALMVTPLALVAGAQFTGYSAESWGWMAGMVLLTTLAGHGLMNLVAKRLDLFSLQVVVVLEPVVGIALGVAIFGAGYTATHVLGGLILSVAVVIGLWPDRSVQEAGEVLASASDPDAGGEPFASSGFEPALSLGSEFKAGEGSEAAGEGSVEAIPLLASDGGPRLPERSSL